MSDKKIAKKTAQKHFPNCKGFRVSRYFPEFLGGRLCIVDFKESGGPDEACVFWPQSDSSPVLLNAEELARRIAAHYPSPLSRIVTSPISFAGVIALIIAFTVCLLVCLRVTADVPVALSAPLAVIVGYYFGRVGRGTTDEVASRAIAAVRGRERKAMDIRIEAVVHDFLDGDLAIVSYKTPQNEWEIYVFFEGTELTVYDDAESLATRASTYQPPRFKLINMVASVSTLGGVLAVLICLTLCWSVAHNLLLHPLASSGIQDAVAIVNVDTLQKSPSDGHVPLSLLSSALTSILGFYFGSQRS